MAEKYLDLSGLTTYDGKIKAHINSVASNKADKTHKHTVSDITDLTVDATELNYMDGVTSNVQAQIDGKVSNTTTINGKALSSNITLSTSDIGAAPASHEHSASKITSGILAVKQGGTGNMWGYVRAGAQEGSTIGSLATAEGRETIASGYCSHAEGNYCEATGTGSHAEGQNTEASGTAAHSEGEGTEAGGNFSHAEGEKTVASGKWQHVQGKYNIEDTTDTYAHIVGNGESNSTRSNAHTLDWDGNAWFAGDVTVTDSNGNSISVLGLIDRINELETMMGQVNTLLDEINGEVV